MQIDLNKVSGVNATLGKTLKGVSNEELARVTVELDALMENVEATFKAAKAEILTRKDFEKSTYFADEKLKVVINDGKAKHEYNIAAIGNAFKAAERLADFFKIVQVIGGKVDEAISEGDAMRLIIANNKTTTHGDPFVSVSKMTKEEISKGIAAA